MPAGALAFLFTDIEASTRRWEGDREAMGADLASHDAVMNAAVAAHQGRRFTHTGDGLGAVFPTAAAAIAAAVAGQRSLAGLAWKGKNPLRVRMGVHVGVAEARAGTFFGPTLNLTTRLLDHARGGEIVCSQVAADLARGDLPAGVTLVDVGPRPLKGLSRPERLSQVVDPAAPVPDPPEPDALPGRLPASASSFVGREVELSELVAVVAEARLVTITGLGGAGKTRLALELAARIGRHYADGARIVELVSVREARLVPNQALSAVGADPGSSTGPAAQAQLCQALADRQLLLILDNCEHLLEPAASLAAGVLRHCPDVTILATSREGLSVPGEVAWPAPGLSLPAPETRSPEELAPSDAAGLFVVRARAAHADFTVTAGNAAAVAAICRRLDGIPLAIELAAARVKVLGVAGVAARLEDRFRLLVGGPRSAPARHQTLRAALDWGFEQLPPPEQRLLRRISVFPQSFDLDAAAAVTGDCGSEDVIELLGRLIDTSFLVAEGTAGTARYRLLETVRQYGATKLADAGEAGDTRGDHWRHFAQRIESAYRSGLDFFAVQWSDEISADNENYNTALAAAFAGGDLPSVTVLLAGLGNQWLWGKPVPTVVDSIAPEMLRCPEPSLHVEALFSLAMGGLITDRWPATVAVGIYQLARDVADRVGTARDRGLSRMYLGYTARSVGDTATARTWMEEALLRGGNESVAVAWHVHYELGWIEMIEGTTASALEHFRRGLTLAEGWPGHTVQEVHLRAALALAETIEGHRSVGAVLAQQAVDEARTLDLPGVLVMALVRAAEAAALAGESTQADLVELFRLLRDQGSRKWVAAALTVAALTQAAAGRPAGAACLLGGAAGVADSLGEDPLPLPAIAALVATTRRRLLDMLGPAAVAEHEKAGRDLPLSRLFDTAISCP